MGYGRQTVERRQLGLTLRRLREEAGLTQAEAARSIGRNAARISQVETAKGSLSTEELTSLLDRYGVPEADRETVLALGTQTRKRQRGRTYTDLLPQSFERLADLQADAKAVGFYDTGIVPGLAQSQDYVRAVISACDGIWWDPSEDEIERRVEFRLEQQRRVFEAEPPKSIEFVLTETALDQVVGNTAVLRGQILHLLQLSERPNISVQVMDNNVPNNPILGGGLITLDFGDSAPRIAFAASHGPATYHDQDEDTRPMFRAFEQVRELSLAPNDSTELLLTKLKELH
ncbi:helix-turn-helix domain-containing protein [Haloactinomyces albus]|uniref:Transcriptional regulator with XRE-family HTH domain n=1 Tax=Haloactinomyces albus TaxID=1352928 RepID=A0AAE3ZEC2_9ACTN|nr:helix-turn-helix transcriptional regulator [Haloactinomyces albus]MDR7301672.1 transcriptional regulator with XRE-family HTH domain [Haloactinomyces albus]